VKRGLPAVSSEPPSEGASRVVVTAGKLPSFSAAEISASSNGRSHYCGTGMEGALWSYAANCRVSAQLKSPQSGNGRSHYRGLAWRARRVVRGTLPSFSAAEISQAVMAGAITATV